MNEHDLLVWAAGFFDGEGCVQVSQTGRGTAVHALRISAPQVTPVPLQVLADVLGGAVHPKRYEKAHGHREQWVWEITSHRAARALRRLLPYLVLKREEALLAILYQESKTTKRGVLRLPLEEAEQGSFREALMEARFDPYVVEESAA